MTKSPIAKRGWAKNFFAIIFISLMKGGDIMDVTEKDPKDWTVLDVKELNERLKNVGLPRLILDEEHMMVYKDDIHQILGIGLPLKKEEKV